MFRYRACLPFVCLFASCVGMQAANAAQQMYSPVLNAGEHVLRFDWPIVQVGTAEYEEGPTGVTVFRFGKRVHGAIDVRGGGPGTVNSDYLRLGYTEPELDAVVFAGGSWYGLEAATAVDTALKDDGIRDGNWVNIGLSVGSIIYDLGDRRLNEIYPDKTLAQAAFRAARPGVFPLGAQGAGRFARTGSFFGCNAYGGQGGAFRQIGEVRIAAFTVVNAVGVITDREGNVVACYPGAQWPAPLRTSTLLAGMPESKRAGWAGAASAEKRNTTISVVMTNVTLTPAELQRFAVQVHTSVARAVQPFATEYDGDVLYAVSTAELERDDATAPFNPMDLGVMAAEVMWDAVLASVPIQPVKVEPSKTFKPTPRELRSYAGEYVFSDLVSVRVTAQADRLYAQAIGSRDAFAIKRDVPTELLPVEASMFTVPWRYPLTVRFEGDRLIFNPGHWQQTGVRRGR